MQEACIKRLRWRIRRGSHELDALLGFWLDEIFAQTNDAQRQAFDQLLDVSDPTLWEWCTGQSRPPRADWQAIIDDIHTRYRF